VIYHKEQRIQKKSARIYSRNTTPHSWYRKCKYWNSRFTGYYK